jgi:hypothetical protein
MGGDGQGVAEGTGHPFLWVPGSRSSSQRPC